MAERIIGYVKGPKGDAATVSVGSTTTLPAGSQATVTNSGTSSAATLNFGIPKGDKGDPGTPGVSDYATDQAAGLVRLGDDFSINSSNGVLSLKNAFTKAASLAALVSQEAFAISMGKIAKAVDTVITIAGDYLKSTDIVDSLTSSLKTKALSAKQGKALKDGLDSLNDSITELYTPTRNNTYTTSGEVRYLQIGRIVVVTGTVTLNVAAKPAGQTNYLMSGFPIPIIGVASLGVTQSNIQIIINAGGYLTSNDAIPKDTNLRIAGAYLAQI